jgi:hypothetical protein
MKRFIARVMAVGSIASILGLVSGCDEKPTPSAQTNAASPSQSAPAIAEAVKDQPPAPPEHSYAMSEDGEYGYQKALSDDDIKAGRATAALLMVRYAGEKNGTRSIKIVDGDVSNMFSCSAPCKFVKRRIFFAGRLMKTETVPVTDGSVIQAVMSDAFNDQLKVYDRQAN